MAGLICCADPMCSWCYGFGPELSALCARLPAVPIRIAVGGLRTYDTQGLASIDVKKAGCRRMLRGNRLLSRSDVSGSARGARLPQCQITAYCICWPPLIAIFAPVKKAASSDAR